MSGADPGFCVRGNESRRGIGGLHMVSSGSRHSPGMGLRGRSPPPPRMLLCFEYLGSFSVNNFEAFCECDEVH